MRVLVTGGNGFIGRHLIAALANRADVRVLDPADPPPELPSVEFVRGSVLDRGMVARALDGVSCVYHLAALANLWTAKREDFDLVNRVGTEIVLDVAREHGVPKVVHCSTEVVLLRARPRDVAIDEQVMPALSEMAGPYSRSKYLAEQAALGAAARGQHVVIVNPTLPIAPGDCHFTAPTAMLEHFISGARMFLDCVLNLVDTRDIAAGMMLAAERGRSGERYLLGGENLTLAQLLDMLDRLVNRRRLHMRVPRWLALSTGAAAEWIARFTGRTPIATSEGVRLAMRSAELDCRKAMRELGYRPRPIEDALGETVRWLTSERGLPLES